MIMVRVGTLACRLHVEEIVGYSDSWLFIRRSLQVWQSLRDVCCVFFIKVLTFAKNLIFNK